MLKVFTPTGSRCGPVWVLNSSSGLPLPLPTTGSHPDPGWITHPLAGAILTHLSLGAPPKYLVAGKSTVGSVSQVHNDASEPCNGGSEAWGQTQRNTRTNTKGFTEFKKKSLNNIKSKARKKLQYFSSLSTSTSSFDPRLTTTWLSAPLTLTKLIFKIYLGSFQGWFAWEVLSALSYDNSWPFENAQNTDHW